MTDGDRVCLVVRVWDWSCVVACHREDAVAVSSLMSMWSQRVDVERGVPEGSVDRLERWLRKAVRSHGLIEVWPVAFEVCHGG